MCRAVFHLFDFGIRIVRIHPLFIGCLVLPLAIHPPYRIIVVWIDAASLANFRHQCRSSCPSAIRAVVPSSVIEKSLFSPQPARLLDRTHNVSRTRGSSDFFAMAISATFFKLSATYLEVQPERSGVAVRFALRPTEPGTSCAPR
jgi:hypothetical protein